MTEQEFKRLIEFDSITKEDLFAQVMALCEMEENEFGGGMDNLPGLSAVQDRAFARLNNGKWCYLRKTTYLQRRLQLESDRAERQALRDSGGSDEEINDLRKRQETKT